MPTIRNRNGRPYRVSSNGDINAATAYTTTLGATSGNVGASVTLTFAPVGASWPVNEVITPTVSGVAGTFSPTTVSATGSGSFTCTFTPSAAGTAILSSTTSPAMTNASGAQNYSVHTVVSTASAYTTTLGATNGNAGSPVTMTFSPTGGPWPANEVITPIVASGNTGTFSPTTIAASGTNSVSCTFTPNGTGTSSLSSTTSPTMTNTTGALNYISNIVTATAYTTSLSASSVNVGSPVVMTFTPNAGVWPTNEVITPTVSGVPGTFSATTISATGSGSFTCTFTPSAAGTASLNSTTSPSLTNTSGAQSVTVLASTGYAPLSDITWTQYEPYNATVYENNGANYKPCIGEFYPVGGVGPFLYSVDNANYVGWTTARDDTLYPATPSVYPYLVGPTYSGAWDSSNNVTLRVTDQTGATVSKTVTINTDAASARLAVCGNRNWVDSVTTVTHADTFDASGGMTGAPITLTDPSGVFQIAYRSIYTQSNGPAPVGNYPMTLSSPGLPNRNITINVASGAIAGPVVFYPSFMSSSMPSGTVVGYVGCTTPWNQPKWSINEPTGTLGVTAAGKIIIATGVNQPTVGTYTFTITVQEGTASLTSGTFSITCAQGTVLPPSNMTLTVASGLRNDISGQHIGTPTVTGITGTKSWSIVNQTYYNPQAEFNFPGYNKPAPIVINASTGSLDASSIISADPDGSSASSQTVTISCTDGINSCTQTFTIPVAWAPSTTYYVGQGMSSAHPGFGFETYAAAYAATGINNSHSGTVHLLVYANANPDYYVGDTGGYTFGPLIIEGVANGGVAQPRFGGPIANNGQGGVGNTGKGNINATAGDIVIKNIEFSCVHGVNSGDGGDAIHKEGGGLGNLMVQGCYVHDCDDGFLGGHGHGEVIFDSCEFDNCGTAINGSGPCHNIYVGEMTKATLRNSVSRRTTYGHLWKCRAMQAVVHDNRLFDGVGGDGGHLVNFPYFGNVQVYNNIMIKGTMVSNPDVLRAGEDAVFGAPWDVNTLTFHDNQIDVLTMNGNHWGTPTVVGCFDFANRLNVRPTITCTNNSVLLSPGAQFHQTYNSGAQSISDVPGVWTITGTTTRTTPVSISMARPYLSGNLPVSGPLYRNMRGDDNVNNYDGVYQYQDKDILTFPVGTTAGTVICNMWASSNIADGANRFSAGTTWSIITDGVYYPYLNPNPWAATGKYNVSTNGDGSATLTVGQTLTAGIDYVQIRATAPGGALCDCRYAIVVS